MTPIPAELVRLRDEVRRSYRPHKTEKGTTVIRADLRLVDQLCEAERAHTASMVARIL